MMLRLVRRIFMYLLLLIYGRGQYDRFLQEVRGHCKKRHNRKHVPGITEELDELLDLPNNCSDDMTFVGFTTEGQVASFRVVRSGTEQASITVDLPGTGRFSYSHSRPHQQGQGPLQLEVLAPMRRWKISFRGRVQRLSTGEENDLVHMSAFFYWQCLADPFDHLACLSRWQLAGSLSDLAWDFDARRRFFNRESIWYEQWGEMRGRIEVEGQESHMIRMKGFRKHTIERIGGRLGETLIAHHLIQDDGRYYITNGGVFNHHEALQESFGYLTVPLGVSWVSDQSTIGVTKQEDLSEPTSLRYPLQIYANGRSFKIDQIIRKEIARSDLFENCLCFVKCTINERSAYGITNHWTFMQGREAGYVETRHQDEIQTKLELRRLTINLQDDCSMMSSLVGGKAANLSILHSLKFPVPKGFVVTTQALKEQIDSSLNLQDTVRKLESDIRNKRLKSLPESCERVAGVMRNSVPCPAISDAIEHELVRTFGSNFLETSFAVRSSGVSEDGKETSYAGQMETYLGIKGLENILLAVGRCWASSFGFQVVDYRHQNGQPVVEPMAVVIQEMVDADVAGVLFTNDPVTGNTSTMMINAAPGLGETVVSGKCNPDTIMVKLGKSRDDFTITEKAGGEKTSKLVCSKESGVTEVNIDERDRKAICMSDHQIREICKLGGELEEVMGHPQDIEWSVSKGQIYLLQTRPITSQTAETDEDLLHEFDSPLAMDGECNTICNIGEAFPGVASTLAADLFISSLNDSVGGWVGANCGIAFPMYADKSVLCFTNKPCFGFTAMSAHLDCFMQEKAALDISITGRELQEHSFEMINAFKGGPVSTLKSLKAFVNANFIQAPKHIKWFSEWVKRLEAFSLEKNASTAKQQYSEIDENLHLIYDCSRAYLYLTTQSFIPYAIMYKLLQGKSGQVTRELNADMAVLLAGCPDLYTADVPRSLQQLAKAIAKSDIKETFMQLPDHEGHDCILNAEESVRRRYEEFLVMHGHRCVNEAEVLVKSWRSDPSTLVHALKLLIASPSRQPLVHQDRISDKDAVDMLQTPLSWVKKYLLRAVLLPKAKAGIISREVSKSQSVQTIEAFKRAFWKLSDLMVREGRLPEETLLFFLTYIEIGSLLESRSAVLVRRARRRMYIHRRMQAVRYPKLSYGLPTPLSQGQAKTSNAALTVRGMPVSRGVAMGRACVILTLADADNIEAGDILICFITDIGWTPYFSLIAGLVTEIGGIISHGAVVAREVAIPCVVNVADATHLFKTGDKVRMDGLAGIVQRVAD